jgi:hypothetical protein
VGARLSLNTAKKLGSVPGNNEVEVCVEEVKEQGESPLVRLEPFDQ